MEYLGIKRGLDRVERRTTTFLVMALVLHLLAVVLLPAAHKAAKPEDVTGVTWLEVEETASGTVTGARTEGTTTRVAGAVARRDVWRGVPGTSETVVQVEAPPSPTASTSSSAEPPSGLFLEHGSIGLDGPGSYRMGIARQQPSPDESARVANDVNHAIMDPIHERERLNGTLADGPIVAELESTTRKLPGSPFEGRAVFAFRIDELGLVVSASVEDVSGDRRAWEDVAKATFNALAQKRLRLPPGAKGVAMRVELTSKVVLPSGARRPLTVTSPLVDSVGHVLQGNVDQNADSPAIVGGSFDLSDIGARPMRVVGARVLSETAF